MAKKFTSYSAYSENPQLLVGAYRQDGVEGLEGLGLSDSDIIQALRRDCIGCADITPVLHQSGWSRERFEQAEKDFGVDSESLALIMSDFDSLSM